MWRLNGLYLRVLDSRYGVLHLLQCGRNSNNLLNGLAEADHVIFPIEDVADIKILVLQTGRLEPFAEIVLHNGRLCLPDGRGDGALSDRRTKRAVGNDKLAVQALVLDNFSSKELAETAGGGLRCALLAAVLLELFAHVSVLANEADKLVSL